MKPLILTIQTPRYLAVKMLIFCTIDTLMNIKAENSELCEILKTMTMSERSINDTLEVTGIVVENVLESIGRPDQFILSAVQSYKHDIAEQSSAQKIMRNLLPEQQAYPLDSAQASRFRYLLSAVSFLTPSQAHVDQLVEYLDKSNSDAYAAMIDRLNILSDCLFVSFVDKEYSKQQLSIHQQNIQQRIDWLAMFIESQLNERQPCPAVLNGICLALQEIIDSWTSFEFHADILTRAKRLMVVLAEIMEKDVSPYTRIHSRISKLVYDKQLIEEERSSKAEEESA
jgi:hypothetical protein